MLPLRRSIRAALRPWPQNTIWQRCGNRIHTPHPVTPPVRDSILTWLYNTMHPSSTLEFLFASCRASFSFSLVSKDTSAWYVLCVTLAHFSTLCQNVQTAWRAVPDSEPEGPGWIGTAWEKSHTATPYWLWLFKAYTGGQEMTFRSLSSTIYSAMLSSKSTCHICIIQRNSMRNLVHGRICGSKHPEIQPYCIQFSWILSNVCWLDLYLLQ